jgi:hypothetical protein
VTWGIGGSGSISFVPGSLQTFYGGDGLLSYTLFIRAKLGRGTETRGLGKAEQVNPQVQRPLSSESITVSPVSPLPKMSPSQLRDFFDACKTGTSVQLSLRGGKTEIAVFESYDPVTDTVWFYNPPGSFFRTRAFHFESILTVQAVHDH